MIQLLKYHNIISALEILWLKYMHSCWCNIFTIFALSAGFQHTKINIGNTGNQNHPDFKVRVVLVTCISNIDYLEAGNQPIMQKNSIGSQKLFEIWLTCHMRNVAGRAMLGDPAVYQVQIIFLYGF